MPQQPNQMINYFFNQLTGFIMRMSKTRANYWGEFAVDIPLGLALIIMSVHHHDLDMSAALPFVVLGLFLFSFFEYFIHRWLFHGRVRIMAEGHRSHHLNPMGYDSLPFFLPAMVLLILSGMLILAIPANLVFLLTGTITFGYVVYGLSHYAIHHVRFQNRWARRWSAHHLIHHRHPQKNFGVTTPTWDVVLGTRYIYNHKV